MRKYELYTVMHDLYTMAFQLQVAGHYAIQLYSLLEPAPLALYRPQHDIRKIHAAVPQGHTAVSRRPGRQSQFTLLPR